MFDIGFSELLLVFIIGLIVLGPQRMPVAVRTVAGWIRALRSMAANVQNELAQELKMSELQESLRKVEQASKDSFSPELKESVDELKKTADSMKKSYLGQHEQEDDEANIILNPLTRHLQDGHEGSTPAAAHHQASSHEQSPAEQEQSDKTLHHTDTSSAVDAQHNGVTPDTVVQQPNDKR